jgi:hypothetical protein
VRIESPEYIEAAPLDLYVSLEVANDDFNLITLQYDKAAVGDEMGGAYSALRQGHILAGGGGWRTLHFHLPNAALQHRQNHRTDFRFSARNLAVRSVRVRTSAPEGYDPQNPGASSELLEEVRTDRPEGMELTIGTSNVDDLHCAVFAAMGVSSIESYVHWASVEGRGRDEWDWSQWDKEVATLQRHGLKWVPFLIAGPAYATPLWFQESDESQVYRCLEHDQDNKVQSLFNPALPTYVDRFIAAFAERYRDTGVIESVLLGVTGIYGESIYPASSGDGWTAQLTGPYHNHMGWWAGDTHAVSAFRHAMRRRYWWIGRLNRAWGTDYEGFAEVSTFLPEDAPSDRACADLAEWYQEAMTEWSVLWVRLTRKHFPESEIYLCTGGDGNPALGADFTTQTKAIARYDAGVRITNEASDYGRNFRVTREVATATRFYETFAGFEPAGAVDPFGVVARIYNATASGIRQLHYYAPNILQSGNALQNYRANARLLKPRTPIVTTALYVPRETWAVAPDSIPRFYAHALALRELVDYDMVTRTTVADGILDRHRLLVLVESAVLEPKTTRAIARWVRGGGILIVLNPADGTVGERLYDTTSWRERFLTSRVPTRDLTVVRMVRPGPDAWSLELGTDEDGQWVFGDWFHRERGLEWPAVRNARKRWSGAHPGVYLPTRPGAAYLLRLDAYLAGASVQPEGNTVLVNGVEVGRLDRAGQHVYEFTIPAEALAEATAPARLRIRMNTWVPSEVSDTGDDRHLGVALHRVTVVRDGADEQEEGSEAALEVIPSADAWPPLIRRVGRGWTVTLNGLGDDPDAAARALGCFLRDTPDILAGVPPIAPEDGRTDGVFATVTEDGVLRYHASDARISLGTSAE